MSRCEICGGDPEFAVNSLVSTRQVSPRVQKCSRSVLLCKVCLHATFCNVSPELPVSILESLREAYTAVAARLPDNSAAINGPEASEVTR
jgi:hypothetical protein